MPKRDYRSYNVLGEDLAQEEVYEEVQVPKQENIVEPSLIETGEKDKKDIEVKEPEIKSLETNNKVDRKVNLGKEYDIPKQTNSKKVEVTVDNKEEKKDNGKIDEKRIQEEEDMSFSAYKSYYQTKERSRLAKWSMRLVKIIIILMLLPFLGVIAFTAFGVLGAFIVATATVLGTGVFILGVICFVSTQINASIIALGISTAIAALSLGGILLILFIMLMKWIISLINKYRKPHKRISRKEVR